MEICTKSRDMLCWRAFVVGWPLQPPTVTDCGPASQLGRKVKPGEFGGPSRKPRLLL